MSMPHGVENYVPDGSNDASGHQDQMSNKDQHEGDAEKTVVVNIKLTDEGNSIRNFSSHS